ncbi:MAG TPA: hypothetical protein ENI15_17010 [Spirochaetes bacterium]|nr:hypothetical protein [Spirochaetota bacterium]
MPSIERKSIDRIGSGDRVLVDVSTFSRAGRVLDEKAVRLLGAHKVLNVLTISLNYEDQEKLKDPGTNVDEERIISGGIEKRTNHLMKLRYRLLEKVKTFYMPFRETQPAFVVKGKKRHITLGTLLEQEPGPLYDMEIKTGSQVLMPPNDVKYIMEIVKAIYGEMDRMLKPHTEGSNKKARRLCLNSIRLQSTYSNARLQTVGDALPWHAVDTALYFLYVVLCINKKRIIEGRPISLARFDPDKKSDMTETFQYPQEFLIDAVMGILLHNIGFYHDKIHQVVSSKPILSFDDSNSQDKIRMLQKSYFVTRNLLKNRDDISSISRMMCANQYEYADGTGYPPINDNKFLHEFIRLFQLVDFYDEMTNPAIGRVPYSRMDVLGYIDDNAGVYKFNREKVAPQKRFDKILFNEFLELLAPYDIEEKLYVYTNANAGENIFVGRVHSYLQSHIPLISILKDERNGKQYPSGQLLMFIPAGLIMQAKGGKILKKTPLDWLKDLKIYDKMVDPGDISAFYDNILGKLRVLSKRWRES